jgi:hypothetical protein
MYSSIAVLDTRTGALSTAGRPHRKFPAASVVKTMIATRILLQGEMSGENEALARLMITKSDNDAAYDLYSKVGGDGLLPWIARHYRIHRLGEPPAYAGFWGSTRITAAGMAHFYAAVRADPIVWPWLSRAMHDHEPVSSAGEPNDFGLAALRSTAVKNGWNELDDKAHPDDAEINTTGFVDHDRYAVAILSEGPASYYFVRGEQIVTAEARLLFPAR